MIDVYVRGYGVWHLIEFPVQFIRRWDRARRKQRFFEIRYAGGRYLVNPNAIMMAAYKGE